MKINFEGKAINDALILQSLENISQILYERREIIYKTTTSAYERRKIDSIMTKINGLASVFSNEILKAIRDGHATEDNIKDMKAEIELLNWEGEETENE